MKSCISMNEAIDLAAECNTPPDGYFSTWDILGAWQIEVLKKIGLKTTDNLLDIGCGALRLGVCAIPYLVDGKYCGVDAFDSYIRIAEKIKTSIGDQYDFDVRLDTEFNFGKFGVSFDYAIAQSVFTHLSTEQIKTCLKNLYQVTNPGAKFLATVSPIGPIDTVGFLYGGIYPMLRPIPEALEEYIKPGKDVGFDVEITDIEHPTGQTSILYTRN